MNSGHRALAGALEAAAGGPLRQPDGIDTSNSHSSGGHAYYGLSVPARRKVARIWLAGQRRTSPEEVLTTVASLLTSGGTYEERTLGGELIRMRPDVRRMVRPDLLEGWLDHQVGWAEVDSLCQSTFPAEQLLAEWSAWSGLIAGLSRSDNINKRRASLVLLTGPVARSDDTRLRDLSLQVIGGLAAERPILITKAVSWLLRSMVRRHPAEVGRYLHDHTGQLPAIAVRETTRLLATGTKSGRRSAR